MNKKFAGLMVLTVIFSIFLMNNLYCEETKQDEQEFQAMAKEFNSIMASFDMESDDYFKEAQKYQPALEKLIDNLKSFILKNVSSRYVDDAAYLLTKLKMSSQEKYVQELRLFLKEYPDASLEGWTLNNLEIIIFEKEIGVIPSAKFELLQSLYFLKRYEESAEEARNFIDNLDIENLTEKGYRTLSLAYVLLMKDYEAMGDTEKIKEVCKEAIEKTPQSKDKETFIKKLEELGAQGD